MRVELSNGNHAELREDVEAITNGERRPVYAALLTSNRSQAGEDILTADEAMIALVVQSWSLPMPLPSEDPGVLAAMNGRDYDILSAAVQPYFGLVFGGPGPQEVDPTPGSPTSGSSESEPG